MKQITQEEYSQLVAYKTQLDEYFKVTGKQYFELPVEQRTDSVLNKVLDSINFLKAKTSNGVVTGIGSALLAPSFCGTILGVGMLACSMTNPILASITLLGGSFGLGFGQIIGWVVLLDKAKEREQQLKAQEENKDEVRTI